MNTLHCAFITRRLHVTPEIPRSRFTATIHNRELTLGQSVGAYYHDTSFAKRNYCLLAGVGERARARARTTVNSRHFATSSASTELLRRLTADTLAGRAARAILTSLSETSITRYRVINSDHYISGAVSAFPTVFTRRRDGAAIGVADGILPQYGVPVILEG